MLTLEEIRKKLEDRNIKEVARRTKLSQGTLYRIQKGVLDINYKTLEVLNSYFKEN